MKNFGAKLILISLVLATLTTYLGYTYIKKLEVESSNIKYKKILVASVDIPSRTKITSKMIKEIEVNEQSYLLNSIDAKEEILGKYSKDRILKGEVIPSERLMEEEKEDLSLRISEGKRAISISVDEMSGVGDLVKPRDYVDIYVTVDEVRVDSRNTTTIYPQISKLLLQNIEVLAISKEMNRTDKQRKESPDRYSVTLAVSPKQGEKLVLGEDLGRLKMALRPLREGKIFETSGAARGDLVPDKGKMTIQK